MRSNFPAHINFDGEMQTVEEHCRAVAEIASQRLGTIELSEAGYLVGLVHDCGKFTNEFKDYIERAANGKDVKRGSVNHTFAGVRLLLEKFHEKNFSSQKRLVSEILAYVVGAHHGLFDCFSEVENNEGYSCGFTYRMMKNGIHYEEAISNFFQSCTEEANLSGLFEDAEKQLSNVILQSMKLCPDEKKKRVNAGLFYRAVLVRVLLSALIDADRCDTASFMENSEVLPMRSANWSEVLERVEAKLDLFEQKTPIDLARREISQRCRDFAKREDRLVRLNVPTGGGKTLSSLRYALAHAAIHNKSRIFFVAPLLTIIEQNAKIIRDFVQDDKIILEHHSNVIRDEDDSQSGSDKKTANDELSRRELFTENWDSPIVITTLVQMLQTFFSHKTTSIRRFQSLCNSVIIFDEAQSVPVRMLSAFNLTLNFLTEICGATVVLCSATQPCLEAAYRPLWKVPADMVPHDETLWQVFKRTTVVEANAGEPMSIADLADLVKEKVMGAQSVLVVCNTRNEAQELFQKIEEFDDLPAKGYFLSAAMCTAHRRVVLEELRGALDSGQKVFCISTQVIEAGVDISFGGAIRICAGLDNIVQTAGRCNRNGESKEVVPVLIAQLKGESLSHLQDIKLAQDATGELLESFKQNKQRYQEDLTSDEAVRYYYKKLYESCKGSGVDSKINKQDDRIKNTSKSIFQLLSGNEYFVGTARAADKSQYNLRQAFLTAGKSFHVFDQETVPVLVPYGDGKNLIVDLNSANALWNAQKIRNAQPYTISLFQNQVKALLDVCGLVLLQEKNKIGDGGLAIYALKESFYDEEIGLNMKPTGLSFLEV